MVRDHNGANRIGVAILCPAPVEKAVHKENVQKVVDIIYFIFIYLII